MHALFTTYTRYTIKLVNKLNCMLHILCTSVCHKNVHRNDREISIKCSKACRYMADSAWYTYIITLPVSQNDRTGYPTGLRVTCLKPKQSREELIKLNLFLDHFKCFFFTNNDSFKPSIFCLLYTSPSPRD